MTAGGHPTLEIRRPARRLLKLTGELDLATADALEEAIAEEAGPGDLVLDLAELTFMDSTGIRLILHAAATCDGDANVVLLDVSASIMRVLEIAGINGRVDNLIVLPADR